MRLNKFVRDALGISRRGADIIIQEGKIKVNGKIVKEPFYNTKDDDTITFKGKILKREPKKVVYIYYKPRGVVSTLYDPHAERTVSSELSLPKGLKFAGRLDKESEGLMVITNDGNIIQRLTHPSYKTKKGYLVRTKRAISEKEIHRMLKGIEDKGEFLKVDKITKKGKNLYLFILHEGKKREIRRLIRRFNNEVLSLKRIFMGEFVLPRDMRPGEIRKITPSG